jgi:hypothetical protein
LRNIIFLTVKECKRAYSHAKITISVLYDYILFVFLVLYIMAVIGHVTL